MTYYIMTCHVMSCHCDAVYILVCSFFSSKYLWKRQLENILEIGNNIKTRGREKRQLLTLAYIATRSYFAPTVHNCTHFLREFDLCITFQIDWEVDHKKHVEDMKVQDIEKMIKDLEV